MWSITYGFGDNAHLPQTPSVRFDFATELLIHLDSVRQGNRRGIPLDDDASFPLTSLRSITVAHRDERSKAHVLVDAQVGDVNPVDLAEILIHAIGALLEPAARWAPAPPASPLLSLPSSWPPPTGRQGGWRLEWEYDSQRAASAATTVLVQGDGVFLDEEWVEDYICPLLSQSGTELQPWFDAEIAARRPGAAHAG